MCICTCAHNTHIQAESSHNLSQGHILHRGNMHFCTNIFEKTRFTGVIHNSCRVLMYHWKVLNKLPRFPSYWTQNIRISTNQQYIECLRTSRTLPYKDLRMPLPTLPWKLEMGWSSHQVETQGCCETSTIE